MQYILKLFHSNIIILIQFILFIFYMKIPFIINIFSYTLYSLYKGECIVSYYHKFNNDNTYKLGKNIYHVNDYFISELRKYSKIINLIFCIKDLYLIYLIYNLTNKNKLCTLIYALLLSISKVSNIGKNVYSKKIRYLILIFIYIFITNENVINNKLDKSLVLFAIIFTTYLIIYNSIYLYKNNEENVLEMSIIGLLFNLFLFNNIKKTNV